MKREVENTFEVTVNNRTYLTLTGWKAMLAFSPVVLLVLFLLACTVVGFITIVGKVL